MWIVTGHLPEQQDCLEKYLEILFWNWQFSTTMSSHMTFTVPKGKRQFCLWKKHRLEQASKLKCQSLSSGCQDHKLKNAEPRVKWKIKLRDGGPARWRKGIMVCPRCWQRKLCTFPWSSGDAPSWNVLFVRLAATHKSWQKQPLPLCVIWVWLLTGCEEEDKGLSAGWVWIEPTMCWAVPCLQKDQPHSRTAQWIGTTETQQRQQKVEGGKKVAKGRGKGATPLVSKAALAYSIPWPHKTLFSRQK